MSILHLIFGCVAGAFAAAMACWIFWLMHKHIQDDLRREREAELDIASKDSDG